MSQKRPSAVPWIATSEGVARYTPTLWQRPPGLEDLDATIHAVAEDSGGRLWFAATRWLLELDGSLWKRYRLPLGFETHTVQTNSVILMANGRILVKAVHPDRSDAALIFDPQTGRFAELVHPGDRHITLVYPRPAGGVWVATEVPGSPGFRLEIYDGANFQTRAEIGAGWRGANLRCVVERENGDIWLGGSAGGTVYRQGLLVDVFAASKGYTDSGVFALGTLPSGETIAGGRDQVLKYDGRSWKMLRSGLDRIRSFALSRDGSLWVASASGIHRFRDGSWITHQTAEGLPSTIAYLVFEDRQGRVWAGTTSGLIAYHPDRYRSAAHAAGTLRQCPRRTALGRTARPLLGYRQVEPDESGAPAVFLSHGWRRVVAVPAVRSRDVPPAGCRRAPLRSPCHGPKRQH